MTPCPHMKDCEFVLAYVSKVKPHWDDFVTLYCKGSFQDVCHRLKWLQEKGTKPPADLMPTGHRVPGVLEQKMG